MSLVTNETLYNLEILASQTYSKEIEEAIKEYQSGFIFIILIELVLLAFIIFSVVQIFCCLKKGLNSEIFDIVVSAIFSAIFLFSIFSANSCFSLNFHEYPKVKGYELKIQQAQIRLDHYKSTLDERLLLIDLIFTSLDTGNFELRESFCRILKTNSPEDIQILYSTSLKSLRDCKVTIDAYNRYN